MVVDFCVPVYALAGLVWAVPLPAFSADITRVYYICSFLDAFAHETTRLKHNPLAYLVILRFLQDCNANKDRATSNTANTLIELCVGHTSFLFYRTRYLTCHFLMEYKPILIPVKPRLLLRISLRKCCVFAFQHSIHLRLHLIAYLLFLSNQCRGNCEVLYSYGRR